MDTYEIYLQAKESLIEKIKSVMFLETSKACGQMNIRLIDECSDLLMKLERQKDLSQEAIKEKLEIIIPEQNSNTRKVGIRKIIKAILVAALVSAMLFSTSYYVYSSYGDEVLFAFDSLGFGKIYNVPPGASAVYGNNEYIMNGKQIAFYETIDEFIEAEPAGLLYPTVLPDGFSILNISKDYDELGNIEYSFITSNVEKINIRSSEDLDFSEYLPPNTTETTLINGFECYFFTNEIFSRGVLIYNNMCFVINAQTYDDVILIINGLKET